MPIGIIINSFAIILGGIFGSILGPKLPSYIKQSLTAVFGICALGMGVSAIGNMVFMPAVIFAVVVGTVLGFATRLGHWINLGAKQINKPISKLFNHQKTEEEAREFLAALVTIIVLFCASGSGIYGSLDSGMSGDQSILISKSILDFFTAAIFASTLGPVVSVIAVPQTLVFLVLFYSAKLILPLTTPDMISDFKACGGFLMLATGFRMTRIKDFPVADMIPSMIIIMPLSWLWSTYIVPFVSR